MLSSIQNRYSHDETPKVPCHQKLKLLVLTRQAVASQFGSQGRGEPGGVRPLH